MDFYYLPGRFCMVGMRHRFLHNFILTGSAPCRAVQMAAAAVGAKLNLKLLNLMTGDHMKPEFLAVCIDWNAMKTPNAICNVSLIIATWNLKVVTIYSFTARHYLIAID